MCERDDFRNIVTAVCVGCVAMWITHSLFSVSTAAHAQCENHRYTIVDNDKYALISDLKLFVYSVTWPISMIIRKL